MEEKLAIQLSEKISECMKICLDEKNKVVESAGAMMNIKNFEIFVWDWHVARLGFSFDVIYSCFKITHVLYDMDKEPFPDASYLNTALGGFAL